MARTISTRFREWKQAHLSPLKIDFMSLNRLRLNQSAESIFEGEESYTHASRRGSQNLSVWKSSFSSPKIILNPYGTTPLSACVIFESDTPCQLAYTVQGKNEFTFTDKSYRKKHSLFIHGLYPSQKNHIFLQLIDENGTPAGEKELTIQTEPLPEDFWDEKKNPNYPCFQDKDGIIRYYLSIPMAKNGLLSLHNDHLLVVNKRFLTANYKNPAPTHMHEVGLNGYVHRTYYVGTGIYDTPIEEKDERLFLRLPDSAEKEDLYMELDTHSGAVLKFHHKISKTPLPLTMEAGSFTSNAFFPEPSSSPETPFTTLGWLNAPGLHKGASIQTTDTLSVEQLAERYGITAVLRGDTLCFRMEKDILQEVLFSKIDMIYQMDLSPYIEKEHPFIDAPYTIAIPLTEMHSGTYTLVLRFVNGGQAVLDNAILLSRCRN